MRLLVDADPVVYACAFAAENATYYLVVDEGDGQLRQMFFGNGAEMKVWKKENKDSETPLEIVDQIQQVEVKPVSHAKNALRTQLQYIKAAVAEHWKVSPVELHTTCVLSGETNFRNAIATVREYKGNRKEVRKPEHHGALREFFKRYYDAIEVENREADDEIAILANDCIEKGVEYVVATVDKDLDQIPGLKFDYLKKVFYEVDPNEAKVLFWQQVLSGDSTDNIPGCPGIGKKIAEKLVGDWTEKDYSQLDIWEAVCGQYSAGRRHAKCEYPDRNAGDVAVETARLVHLQTYPGQLWTPPGMPDKTVEVGLDD